MTLEEAPVPGIGVASMITAHAMRAPGDGCRSRRGVGPRVLA